MSLPLSIVAIIAIYARTRVKSVADFMAGGRYAGRYLLCTARSEMGAGAVLAVAGYEVFEKAGFAIGWWGNLTNIIIVVAGIAGFVTYRYRQTRAMTLAQFFEMRYSRNFRLFAGVLAFCAGVINYGIIPVVGARFFAYFFGLPPTVQIFSHTISTTLLLMGLFLTVSTLLTTAGGQVTVLATNATEGIFSAIFYFIVTVGLLLRINWHGVRETLLHTPPHESMVNPFDSLHVPDYNVWLVLMGVATSLYGTMAWQNSHAMNSSAISPHEGRMGGILGQWRAFASAGGALVTLGLLLFLNHPSAAFIARSHEVFSRMPADQYETREQVKISMAMSWSLPTGIRGLLCATWLMGLFALDEMHLHSWSSILVQDVILPLRKRPLTVRQHLIVLRLGVIFVATFVFLFGALYQQTQNVALWFAVTQAIFVGGAGAAIIGGLYWSRGTAAGAWVAMIIGSLLSVGGIILQQPFWNHIDIHSLADSLIKMGIHCQSLLDWFQNILGHHLGPKVRLSDGSFTGFPLNGVQVSFSASIIAMLSYVLVSLLTCREPHNMDRLLHRGQYAVEPEGGEPAAKPLSKFNPARIIGIDEHFTRRDRWVAGSIFGWGMMWLLLVAIGSLIYFFHPWSDTGWLNFWLASAGVNIAISVVVCIWFTFGCTRDMMEFFRRLKQENVDAGDDGTVVHSRNLKDVKSAAENLAGSPTAKAPLSKAAVK